MRQDHREEFARFYSLTFAIATFALLTCCLHLPLNLLASGRQRSIAARWAYCSRY